MHPHCPRSSLHSGCTDFAGAEFSHFPFLPLSCVCRESCSCCWVCCKCFFLRKQGVLLRNGCHLLPRDSELQVRVKFSVLVTLWLSHFTFAKASLDVALSKLISQVTSLPMELHVLEGPSQLKLFHDSMTL